MVVTAFPTDIGPALWRLLNRDIPVRVPLQKPIAVLLVPALLAGCYNYVPVEPGAVKPGSEVRARVAAAAAEALSDSLGLSETRLFDGTLVNQQSGDITLSVQTSPQGTVGAPKGIFQNITITKAQLLELESVRIDRVRTGIAIGIVAAGVGIATTLLHGQGSGGDPATEQPPNLNISIFRLRF